MTTISTNAFGTEQMRAIFPAKPCITLLIIVVLSGCAAQEQVETFVLADGHQLSFVRPVSFHNPDVTVTIDFTHNSTPGKEVICNFSVESSLLPTAKASGMLFVLNAGSDTLAVHAMEILARDEARTRYTSRMTDADFRRLVRSGVSNPCVVVLEYGTTAYSCAPSGAFVRALQSVSEVLPNE